MISSIFLPEYRHYVDIFHMKGYNEANKVQKGWFIMKCKKGFALTLTAVLFLSAGANIAEAAKPNPVAAEAVVSSSEIIIPENETVHQREQVRTAQESSSPLSGSCGENLTWKFDLDTDTLVISGSGAMMDFEISDMPKVHVNTVPWYQFKDLITSVQCGTEP